MESVYCIVQYCSVLWCGSMGPPRRRACRAWLDTACWSALVHVVCRSARASRVGSGRVGSSRVGSLLCGTGDEGDDAARGGGTRYVRTYVLCGGVQLGRFAVLVSVAALRSDDSGERGMLLGEAGGDLGLRLSVLLVAPTSTTRGFVSTRLLRYTYFCCCYKLMTRVSGRRQPSSAVRSMNGAFVTVSVKPECAANLATGVQASRLRRRSTVSYRPRLYRGSLQPCKRYSPDLGATVLSRITLP